jgi:Leucine-rich repeat (LRR) protein
VRGIFEIFSFAFTDFHVVSHRFFWIFFALNSVEIFSLKIECGSEISTDYFGNGDFVTCSAENLKIESEKNEKISSIERKHGDKKSNADVETFKIYRQNVKFLPTGLKEFFPRLKQYIVHKSKLEEVKRKSFKSIATLEAVAIYGNKISSIPEDTFYDLTELKILWLGENKLKTLPVNLLMNSKKLEAISMRKNQIEEIPIGFFKKNLELKTIAITKNNLSIIDTTDLFNMKNLHEVKLNNNKCIDKDFAEVVSMEDLNEIKQQCSGKTNEKVKKGRASTKKNSFAVLVAVLLTNSCF